MDKVIKVQIWSCPRTSCILFWRFLSNLIIIIVYNLPQTPNLVVDLFLRTASQGLLGRAVQQIFAEICTQRSRRWEERDQGVGEKDGKTERERERERERGREREREREREGERERESEIETELDN